MKNKKKQEFNLNAIIDEFNVPNRDDRETIEAVLKYCPLNFKVNFALSCALDVEYLMTDVRSKQALRAVESFLKDGTLVSQEVINAAYAYAAYAANAANNPNIYKEKMREYLLKLKELILAEIPSDEKSWLLEVAI